MDAKQAKQLKQNGVLIGDWEEVQSLPLSTITKNTDDAEILDGLIVKGYETKFADGKNANGEVYEPGSIEKFIKEYFVEKKLNMPCDVEHFCSPEWLCGRIVYIEVNTQGFYYVAYIPRTYMHYDHLKSLLANKIIQGFSKYGWATDWEYVKDKDGEYYEVIKEIQIVRMSLVSTPANGVAFERVQEVQNATRFAKIEDQQEKNQGGKAAFADLFRK